MLEYKYKITRLTNLWSCLTMAKVLGGKYYVLFSKIESMRWESKGKQGGLFSKILCLGYLYNDIGGFTQNIGKFQYIMTT